MELTYLIIHCTATPEGRAVTSTTIRRWHTSPPPQGRGWKQVGYSDMVHLDGRIENLVPYNDNDIVETWEITNGAKGFNAMSRHIVYVGGTDSKGKAKDTRTSAQKAALLAYVKDTIAKHPTIKVAGHNQFNSGKACPSFDTVKWLMDNGINSKNIYKP